MAIPLSPPCLVLVLTLLLSSCATIQGPAASRGAAWTDSFDARDPRWILGDWTFDQNLCRFDAEHAVVTNGTLSLSITRAGPGSDRPYRSAEAYTAEEYQYGRFKVRMKPCSPPGVVTSFFLMHIDFDASWKALDWYEIDIEFPGKTDTVSYALHWMTDGVHRSVGKEIKPGTDLSAGFHDLEIVWRKDSVSFLIDGKPSHAFDDPAVMKELRHPMSVHMNYWISESVPWVGKFDPSGLPLATLYDSVSYSP